MLPQIPEQDLFSDDYITARARFRQAVENAGLRHRAHGADLTSRTDGSALTIDYAHFSQGRPVLMILVSGTHGVEGFAGSACQTGLLTSSAMSLVSAQFDLLLIHGLNPFGFDRISRTNEDNVDLNRNFVPFPATERNTAYGEIHHHLVPSDWQGSPRQHADAALARFAQINGEFALQAAASGGQYSYPDGLFYGGTAKSWSTKKLSQILQTHAAGYESVVMIDIHTGLGAFGSAELIYSGNADDAALTTCRTWFGDQNVTCPAEHHSVSAEISGFVGQALLETVAQDRAAPVALEIGTVPMRRGLDALRADVWLRGHPDCGDDLARSIRQELLDCFNPSDQTWRRAVLDRFCRTLNDCLRQIGKD